MTTSIILGGEGVTATVPIRAVIQHIRGEIDLASPGEAVPHERRKARKREQWRLRYQNDPVFRETVKRRAREQGFKNRANPDWVARKREYDREYWRRPENRERKNAARRAKTAAKRAERAKLPPTPEQVEEARFLEWCVKEGASTRTIEKRRAAIRAYFRFREAEAAE